MRKTKEVAKKLKEVKKVLEEVKEYTEAAVNVARFLMDEEEVHGLQDLTLELSSTVGTIENNLSEFQRIAVHSKKYAVK